MAKGRWASTRHRAARIWEVVSPLGCLACPFGPITASSLHFFGTARALIASRVDILHFDASKRCSMEPINDQLMAHV